MAQISILERTMRHTQFLDGALIAALMILCFGIGIGIGQVIG